MAAQNLGRKKSITKKKPQPVDNRLILQRAFIDAEMGHQLPQMFKCVRCGFTTTTEISKFLTVNSSLYKSNDYRLHLCKDCLDELYEKVYRPKTDSDEDAVRIMCQKLDVYYHPDLVKFMAESAKRNRRFSFYVQKTTTQQYASKTYDTTIEEEKAEQAKVVNVVDIDRNDVHEDTVKFWGFGFSPEDYEYLDGRYVAWSASYNIQSEAMSSIFRNICVMELQILKGIQEGEKVDALYRQLNDFMNSAGIQPKQSSENTLSDSASFGTLIKKWEDEKPIPEPKEEWKDVDGIIRYISVWFFGHLCKVFGFKNEWSDLYDQEIEKYKAKKPELEDSDLDSVSFDDIFGGSGDDL